MTCRQILPTLSLLALATAQAGPETVLTNLETAKWTHEKNDPAGMESAMLRSDARSGGMELLVRFPAGHAMAAHWHESNERILVLEGRLTLRRDEGEVSLDPGGYAFLPAREVQRMACGSKSRCTFYLSWDGSPKSYRAKPD